MKFRTYVSGLALIAGLGGAGSACSPASKSNYFGLSPSGRSGQFNCKDLGEAERLCLEEIAPFREDNTKAGSFLSGYCSLCKFSQDCINCTISAPCSPGSQETPLSYCISSGTCPSVKTKEGTTSCN